MAAETLAIELALGRTSSGKPAPIRPMDEARFELFYRKTAGSLWGYLNRLTGDASAADDLMQKSFFRFLRANPALESDDHMRRYIFRTATNLALDYFRENKRRLEHDQVLEMTTTGGASASDLRYDMSRAFSELKPQERALLWLAHVEESDHAEIGEALGVKAASVRVLLFRARKRLAELLTRRGIGPEAVR